MQEERCLVSRDYQDTIFERRKKRVMLKQLIEREKLEERRIIYIRGGCSKEKKESKKNLTQEERCLVSRDLSKYYIRKRKKKGSGGTIDRARKTGRKKDYTFALKRKERIKKESYARRKMSRE